MATKSLPVKPAANNVVVTEVFKKTLLSPKRTVVNVGGRGSSKSWSIAQLLIQRFTAQEGVKIGITRKTFPALRRTCYDLVVTLLKDYGIYPLVQHDRTNHLIRYKDSSWKKESVMDFFALDETTKIQSADFNVIWMEEAVEFTWEDYVVLSTALRTPAPQGLPNRIYLSLNPTDANCWIATKLVEQADVDVIHSTYKDNIFIADDMKQVLENLIFQDDNFYRVYTLGEWGRLENLVFSKYQQVKLIPQGCKWVYGLDFGYTAPTALVKVGSLEGQVYADVKIHKDKITNSDLIEHLTHLDRAVIFADSAEPQRIEEIRRAGYDIRPANKDVKFGLDLMRRQVLNITEGSDTLWSEIRGYHLKKDAEGRVIPDHPVKWDDHDIDAFRYGLCGLVEVFGSAVSSSPRNVQVIHTLTFGRDRSTGLRPVRDAVFA